MSQLILGLGNKARHGKDSFAQAIVDYYAKIDASGFRHLSNYQPVRIQRHAFADALYREVNEFLRTANGYIFAAGWQEVFIGGETRLPDWVQPDPRPEISSRAPLGKHAKLLQWWGTEYRRAQDPEYWVKQWKAGIDPKAQIVLCTDMRFYNEAVAIKNAGGYTVQVNRLNVDGTNFVDPSRDRNHPSEIQLDDYNFDYRITVKTGDLVLLEEWAITLVHYLRARQKGK